MLSPLGRGLEAPPRSLPTSEAFARFRQIRNLAKINLLLTKPPAPILA